MVKIEGESTIKSRREVIMILISPSPSSAPPPWEHPIRLFPFSDSNFSAFRFSLVPSCSTKPFQQLIVPPLLVNIATQDRGSTHPLLQVFQSQTCQSHMMDELDVELLLVSLSLSVCFCWWLKGTEDNLNIYITWGNWCWLFIWLWMLGEVS